MIGKNKMAVQSDGTIAHAADTVAHRIRPESRKRLCACGKAKCVMVREVDWVGEGGWENEHKDRGDLNVPGEARLSGEASRHDPSTGDLRGHARAGWPTGGAG